MLNEPPIYLDYQASTPLDPVVLREMLPYFSEWFANPHSADHAAGWKADAAVQASRVKISRLVGCDQDEIIFTSGATEANNLAILGIRKQILARRRNKIITSRIEHKSILAACRALSEEFGAEILICEVDRNGFIDKNHLSSLMTDEVLLVTFGGINSEIGTIQRIEDACDLATKFGVLVHVDGAQMPVALNIATVVRQADMVSLSGHKMYGPKGIGCLYVKRSLQRELAPIIFGGGQQSGLRSGTLAVPLCVGMGVAAELVGNPAEQHALRTRTKKLWDELHAVHDELLLNGPSLQDRHPGNLNIRFPGIIAEDLLASLQPHLAASIGSACISGISEPSYVLRGIGLSEEEAKSSIRFSLGRFTTEGEIYRAVELIRAALMLT